jgi:hypothetical protein
MLVIGLFAFIGVSKVAGAWQTKPAKVSFSKPNDRPDPDAIRGWMTVQEISKGYGIPVRELYARAGIPANVPPTARLNTISRNWNVTFEPESLRDVVRGFVSGTPAQQGRKQPSKSAAAAASRNCAGR